MKITVSKVTLPLTSVPFDTCSSPQNQNRRDRQLNVLARTREIQNHVITARYYMICRKKNWTVSAQRDKSIYMQMPAYT